MAITPSPGLIVYVVTEVTTWADGTQTFREIGAFSTIEEANHNAPGATDWPQDDVESCSSKVEEFTWCRSCGVEGGRIPVDYVDGFGCNNPSCQH